MPRLAAGKGRGGKREKGQRQEKRNEGKGGDPKTGQYAQAGPKGRSEGECSQVDGAS